MQKPVLIIGNKNYSSWSLRAWLLLKAFGVDFEEQSIELFEPSAMAKLKKQSPTGKVPALLYQSGDKKITVWDSLAIAMHANDYLISKDIWTGSNLSGTQNNTNSRVSSAYCQSIVAEMHSGLMGVRSEMPMNIRATARIKPSQACLNDIARIEQIFADCLERRADDSYLFETFTVADAFFAPIVFRLQTYAGASDIDLQPTTQQYCNTILNNIHVQTWQQEAVKETRIITENEAGEILSTKSV